MKRISMLGALLGALLIAVPGQAATYVYFSLFGSVDAQWRVDEDSVPSFVYPGFLVQYEVTFRFPTLGAQSPGSVQFYTPGQDGGVDLFINDYSSLGLEGLYSPSGIPLYTGTEAEPRFLTGVFEMSDYFTPEMSYTLVVNRTGFVSSPPPPSVPEPASWAMMLLGVGFAGAVLRRRRQPEILAA